MVGHRPEILVELARRRVRFVVMAPTEMTTDVPEHSDLVPKPYWDRRARGLGATEARPAVSCGEENLLTLAGDPYSTENILLHEFAHAVHEMALSKLDETFDGRLAAAYASAISEGLWSGTYAATNRMEYWAEGAQSWFDTNRTNDDQHNDVGTRDRLKDYDPRLAKLLTEAFGDREWRYRKPATRPVAERMHLAGFDPSEAPTFAWPARPSSKEPLDLAALEPVSAPKATPSRSTDPTSIEFVNRRRDPVEVAWLDTRGERKPYQVLAPGSSHLQPTYVGHVWLVRHGDVPLAVFVAASGAGRAEIR
jgi:hypothetical protein